MIREAFKVETPAAGLGPDTLPVIRKYEITDPNALDAVSWRDAKKQLRRWYLEQAAALRQVTKQQYFGEQQ